MTRNAGQQSVVYRCCQAARSQGVQEGISSDLARAFCPESIIASADTAADYDQLYKLALWCTKFSPLVALDRELVAAHRDHELDSLSGLHYGVTIDLTGTERLHGDLAELLKRLSIFFFKRSIDVKMALAPTIGSGWAISRFAALKSPAVILHDHAIENAIGHLPVQALRLGEETVRALHDTGIVWIRELLTLPRRTLGARFGKYLLYRLEQALGLTNEELSCVQSPSLFSATRSFETPLVKRESISFAVRRLFTAVCADLARKHKKAHSFVLTLGSKSGSTLTRTFSLTAASESEKHVIAILDPLLESLPLFEEVFSLSLTASDVVDTRTDQGTFSGQVNNLPDEKTAGEVLNAFSVRLGKDRVSLVSFKESHTPESAFTYVPIATAEELSIASRERQERPVFSMLDRPPLLYPKPQPIRTMAMLPDKPPSLLLWRKKMHRLVTGIGPERIAPEWWKTYLERADFSERDYFKVQDEKGRWFWIYRDRKTMEWFMHGVWT